MAEEPVNWMPPNWKQSVFGAEIVCVRVDGVKVKSHTFKAEDYLYPFSYVAWGAFFPAADGTCRVVPLVGKTLGEALTEVNEHFPRPDWSDEVLEEGEVTR